MDGYRKISLGNGTEVDGLALGYVPISQTELARLKTAEKQRDELLAALSELTSTVGLAIDGATGWDAHKNARMLIASVKEK